MNTNHKLKPLPALCREAHQTIVSIKASVLVYLVVMLLIFGVLGVIITSLFTIATTSSATPNDSRRAYYIAESGVRYALGIVRASNFHPDFIKTINETTSYDLADGGSFTIDIFSPWFEYISKSTDNVTLAVPSSGEIPASFSIPNVTAVNWYTYTGSAGPSDSFESITGASAPVGADSITLSLADGAGFQANVDHIVCLAVKMSDPDDALVNEGEYIYVDEDAKDFFPPDNGAIRVITAGGSQHDLQYEKMEHDEAGNRVKLTNLRALPGTVWSNFVTTVFDDVIVAPYNYRVIATGTSGNVTTELGQSKQVWFFSNTGEWTITERDFIDSASLKVSDSGNPVIQAVKGLTPEEDEITLGGSSPGFGDAWYDGDKSIGGDNNFCEEGACFFQRGIRLFFTFKNSGDGEGFIFALLAGDDGSGGPFNNKDSVGGDFERSELLGYAGDSRRANPPTPRDCVDNDDCLGLRPPKIGLEFDTRTQFDEAFNRNLEYCSGSSLKPNTRNDPRPDDADQDAVQLVFWGHEDPPYTLNIPCRDDSPRKASYDDNRHDAEDIYLKWTFRTGDNVISSPAVGDDGTIYFGSNDTILYAVNPDGSKKWDLNTGQPVRTSPTFGPDGTLYAGSDNGRVYAFDPAEAPDRIWEYPTAGPLSLGRFGIGPDGSIIFTSTDTNNGLVYALNPDGSLKWHPDGSLKWPFNIGPLTGGISDYNPGVDPINGNVYVDRNNDRLVAIDSEGNFLWNFYMDADVDSTPAVAADGTVYFGSDYIEGDSSPDPFFPASPGAVFAINPTNRSNGDSFPVSGNEWRFDTGDENDSSPAIGPDGTIYIGSDDHNVYAINPNGSGKSSPWPFNTGGNVNSSPTVGPDGNIYVGSNDGNIYAIHPDGTPKPAPWPFDTNSNVKSSAAVDDDLTVYIGSNDDNLWAINQLARPRSYRDNSVQPKKMISAADFPAVTFTSPNNWLPDGAGEWAVRMEVNRETFLESSENKGRYTLKVWLEKCTAAGCSKVLNALYRDTLVRYNVPGIPPKLEQVIELSEAEHDKFERFIFGFTTAVASLDTQQSVIKFFELSFIRTSDPVVTSDPNLER